jgi:uncharacterized membrane protein
MAKAVPHTLVHATRTLALLSSGLLAGAFAYGAVNVAPTFEAVPLDVRLTFHSALMRMNGPVMQSAMALAFLTTLALTVQLRGPLRLLAGCASAMTVATFLVTRFGNVPIHPKIEAWAVGTPAADHTEILARWGTFNLIRTGTALAAFVLLLVLVDRSIRHPASAVVPAP